MSHPAFKHGYVFAFVLVFLSLSSCAAISQGPKKVTKDDLHQAEMAFRQAIIRNVQKEGGELRDVLIREVKEDPDNHNQIQISYRVAYKLPALQDSQESMITYDAVSVMTSELSEDSKTRKWQLIEQREILYQIDFTEPQVIDSKPETPQG